MKPLFIEVQDGSHLNLNAVITLKRHGKTILAECYGKTATIKRCDDEELAQGGLELILSCIDNDDISMIKTMFGKSEDKEDEEASDSE